MIIYRSPLH